MYICIQNAQAITFIHPFPVVSHSTMRGAGLADLLLLAATCVLLVANSDVAVRAQDSQGVAWHGHPAAADYPWAVV